jgi:hypothetical protein
MDTPAADNADIQSTTSDTDTQQQQLDWEKRYKDTQAAYTKARQEVAELKARLSIDKKVNLTFDSAQKEELEDLKYSNPEAWRIKMNALEREAEQKLQAELSTKVQEITELEVREAKLLDFQARHPGFELTDDDVPPRIAKKLASGQISFDEFLNEVYEYTQAPRKVASTERTLNQPNLNKISGGTSPSEKAVGADIVSSYKKEIF